MYPSRSIFAVGSSGCVRSSRGVFSDPRREWLLKLESDRPSLREDTEIASDLSSNALPPFSVAPVCCGVRNALERFRWLVEDRESGVVRSSLSAVFLVMRIGDFGSGVRIDACVNPVAGSSSSLAPGAPGSETAEFRRCASFGDSVPLAFESEMRERIDRDDLAEDAVSVLVSAGPPFDLDGLFPIIYIFFGTFFLFLETVEKSRPRLIGIARIQLRLDGCVGVGDFENAVNMLGHKLGGFFLI